MSNEAIKKYMLGEFEALYNDLDKSVAQLILLRKFFRDLVLISKGEKKSANDMSEINIPQAHAYK